MLRRKDKSIRNNVSSAYGCGIRYVRRLNKRIQARQNKPTQTITTPKGFAPD